MTMTKNKKIQGFIILILVALIAFGYRKYIDNKVSEKSVTGFLGGEKIGLFESDEFKDIMKKDFSYEVDYRKKGSYAMVEGDLTGQDYLFPANQLAVELFKKNGGKSLQDDIIFNTPIVLYSREPVVNALINEGVISLEDDVYYLDVETFSKMMAEGKTWADIGLTELYGPIVVDTTDPNMSNSGNMFLGLLANSLNGGQVRTEADFNKIEDDLKNIYNNIGYMQTSSADMFNQFLRQGIGGYPIIAGYENQLLEFSKTDSDVYEKVKDEIVIIYPRPTVWSSHVLIALEEDAVDLIPALKSKKIQELAWKNHGFRTVVAGSGDSDIYDVPGLAKEITTVMDMPTIDVMEKLMETVK